MGLFRKNWAKKVRVKLRRSDAQNLQQYFDDGVTIPIKEMPGTDWTDGPKVPLCDIIDFISRLYADELRKLIRESEKDCCVSETESK